VESVADEELDAGKGREMVAKSQKRRDGEENFRKKREKGGSLRIGN
jgi:hypothetical protein